MSNREIAIELIQKLPENTSLHEIAREIEFAAGIREGFEQINRGEGVPAEEVRQMIPLWIGRCSLS
jgi:predicted transcriptional regulator